jgi:type I restriction enzyme, S subunit
MNNLLTKPLKDLCDTKRAITYGIVQPGKLSPNGIPIVRVNNFTSGGLDLSEVLSVDPDIEKKYIRSRPRPFDILITLVGSIGQVAIAPPNIVGWNLARAVGLIPMPDRHHAEWVYYSIQNRDVQQFIKQHANTTVQATFNLGDLTRLPIFYPDRKTRQGILETLTSIDERIELNKNLTDMLEQMAQTIFRDWFVDFGPVRRKLAGATNPGEVMGGLSLDPTFAAKLAELFPNNFNENDLPSGWDRYLLEEIADHRKGAVVPEAAPSTPFEHYSLPSFDKGEEPAIDLGLTIKSNKTPVPNGAVLLSKLNPETPRVWLPNEFLVFSPKEISSRSLLYALFRDPSFRQMLAGMVTGTSKSHQRISPSALLLQSVIVGRNDVFSAFAALVEPFLLRVLSGRAESKTLAEARDYLLPRLMSGEVRVREK